MLWLLTLTIAISTLLIGDAPLQQSVYEAAERLLFNSQEWNPILDSRLPRLLILFSTGASLAVSGATIQALFSNPLASPSTLGITAGSHLFVLIALFLGLQGYFIALYAILGSMSTLFLLYMITRKQSESHLQSLILTGIALSTLLMAIQQGALYAFRDHWSLMQTVSEFTAGSSIDLTWQHVQVQLPFTLLGMASPIYYRNELNILSLGDEEAKNLGVETKKVRWKLFLSIALLTGSATATMGSIAFFGFVLPHLLRKLQGPDNKSLLLLCIIAGALLLAGLDLFIRFFELYALSLGTLSSFLGGSYFLYLLQEKKTC